MVPFLGATSGVTKKGEAGPKWHAHVRIDSPTLEKLTAHFLAIACHRSPENLGRELAGIPFARYAPIRRQLLTLLKKVNDARSRMGYASLPHSVLSLRRTPIKVYADSLQESPGGEPGLEPCQRNFGIEVGQRLSPCIENSDAPPKMT